MPKSQATIGRGTKIFVAPSEGDRVWTEATTITVGTAPAAAATSITVTISPSLTANIFASPTRPVYLNFIQTNGKSHFVEVIAPITPTSTTLTVKSLKEAITVDAIAAFPLLLANRESANLSDDKTEADIKVFDNNGYRDSLTTELAKGLPLPGFFSQLDAGWRTCFQAANSLEYDEVYVKLELVKPKGYTKGFIFEFFTGVKLPFDIPATEIIKTEIGLMSRGEIKITEPV
jgi:hypothetical protein